ncbi:Uncharacterised protein [uncultured archaeon]|nr:Uncharacterised protein [uncultured archaeon]
MKFAFLENRYEGHAFVFSLGVLALSVLAIVSFVLTGGSILFYAFALLAIALGFYMAYHLSKSPEATSDHAATPVAKRPARKAARRGH